jgi:hypothetical protein
MSVSTVLYVAACLVVPFLWGVLVHIVFGWGERVFGRRTEGRAETTARQLRRERSASMWDYQI